MPLPYRRVGALFLLVPCYDMLGRRNMNAEQKTTQRTIKQRPITFRCEWCGEEHTQLRYPGPTPRYCSEACKREAQNALAAARMRRRRGRQQ